MKSAIFTLIVMTGFGLLSANAQSTDPQLGLVPFQTFHGSNFDHVNVEDGLLNFDIPLVNYPQRGSKLKLSYSFRYNSKYYSLATVCDPADPSDCDQVFVHSRISHSDFNPYTSKTSTAPLTSGFVFVDDQALALNTDTWNLSDGSYGIDGNPTHTSAYVEHQLVTSDGAFHPINSLYGTTDNKASSSFGTMMTLDGSGYRDDSTGMRDMNGVIYGGTYIREDPDGNYIGSLPSSIQDSMGRIIPGFVTTSDTTGCTGSLAVTSVSLWSVPGANGSTQIFKFCYAGAPVYIPGSYCSIDSDLSSTQTVLQSIVLPNLQTWTFEYQARAAGDSSSIYYGEVSKITMPSGGSIRYQYMMEQGANHPCTAVVTMRTVNDGAVDRSWTYSSALINATFATVTDPDGNVTRTDFNPDGYEASTRYYSGSSTLLKEVDTTYLEAVAAITPSENVPTIGGTASTVNHMPLTVTTTMNGMVSKKVLAYCCDYNFVNFAPFMSFYGSEQYAGGGSVTASLGFPADEKDYDFGSGSAGSLLKETSTAYLWQTNATYLSANILNTPSSITTMDGSGTTVAQTTYTYDEATRDSSGITTSLAAAPETVFGHPTTTTSLLTGGANPATHVSWFDTGMPHVQTDARGASSATYAYSSTYAGGLATTITNAASQSTTYVYDTNTDAVTSSTDANGNVTTSTYDDLGRITSVTGPTTYPGSPTAHSLETICYNDVAATCLSDSPIDAIVVTKAMTPTLNWRHEQQFDGLGRPTLGRLLSDPLGTIYSKASYDDLGRTYQVWNPTRCNPTTATSCLGDGGTWGITTHYYDSMGRESMVVPPDGTTSANNVTTAYFGNQTTVTDQAGVALEDTFDGLGRLTQVNEINMSWLTQYQYDTLGNLLCVEQHGGVPGTGCSSSSSSDASSPWRIRRFIYDGLSRLVSSKNPETGTIGYTYDLNSNLQTKTDARGVTVSYAYDALNRLQYKYYPNGETNAFGYDGYAADGSSLSGFGLTNVIGRMTYLSHYGYADTFLGYDSMGRQNLQWNCLPSNCGARVSTSATYDLAGNMTDLTYPDGHHIQQTFDGAGRLSTSNLVDISGVATAASYLQPGSYFPDDSPSVVMLGNGVQQTISKNNRLQVRSMSVASPLAPFDNQSFLSHTYCYVSCATGGTANNGNIWGIVDTLNPAKTQGFTYDALNRISSFSLGGALNQQFGIDPFGNMTPLMGSSPVFTFDPATNRVANLPCASSGAPYDAAGNQLCNVDQFGAQVRRAFDTENRIAAMEVAGTATPFVTYTYGADGARVRKSNADGTFTEYVNFGGQPIAERDQDGNWTDYIYANGKKIAMTPATEAIFQIGGSSSGSFTSSYTTPTPALTGYVFQMGDKLLVRQMQTGAATGGIRLTAGSQTSDGYDLDGQWSTDDHIMGQWHSRVIPLDALAGSTFSQFVFGCGTGSQGLVGAYTVQYASIGVLSMDGTLRTIFDSDPSASFSFLNEDTPSAHGVQAIPATAAATHFFLGDHLGTAQMEFSAAGFPLWQGQFAPYGQELQSNGSLLPPDQPDGSANHYKFTGKERDTESGLDYFGARYYASSMGRWMSPDWADKPEAVPYSDLANPQSLNLYGYVKNNPLRQSDPDGHDDDGEPQQTAVAPPPVSTVPNPTTADTAALRPLVESATGSTAAGAAEDGILAIGGKLLGGVVGFFLYAPTMNEGPNDDCHLCRAQMGDRNPGRRKGDDHANTSDEALWKIYHGSKKDPGWQRAKEELKARGLLHKGSDGNNKKPPKPPAPPTPPPAPDPPKPVPPKPDPPKS